MKDIIQESLKDGHDPSELAQELYVSEYNYNNADVTSGQRCHTLQEIETMVSEVLRK